MLCTEASLLQYLHTYTDSKFGKNLMIKQNQRKANFAFHLYKRSSTDKAFWKLVSLGQPTTLSGFIHVVVFYIMTYLAVGYTEDRGKMTHKFWYPPTRLDNVDTQETIILSLYCFKFISMSLQLFHIHSFQQHLAIIIWPSNPNVDMVGDIFALNVYACTWAQNFPFCPIKSYN